MKHQVHHWQPTEAHRGTQINIIVIGAGPVGVRFAEELKRKNVYCSVTLFGDEVYQPYNRVQLSSLLSRQKDYEDLVSDLPYSTENFTFHYHQSFIKHVDAENQQLITQQGDIFKYDYLVFATGSKPHIPNIQGVR